MNLNNPISKKQRLKCKKFNLTRKLIENLTLLIYINKKTGNGSGNEKLLHHYIINLLIV